MMNMSYCRYENTLHALRECIGDVGDHVNENAQCEVSDSEIEWFRRMTEEMIDFLQDMNLLDEDGYLDEDQLDSICEAMAKSYNEEDEYEGPDEDLY